MKQLTEVKNVKVEDPCPGYGRKWLRRPKLCPKSCRAVLRRKRRRPVRHMGCTEHAGK